MSKNKNIYDVEMEVMLDARWILGSKYKFIKHHVDIQYCPINGHKITFYDVDETGRKRPLNGVFGKYNIIVTANAYYALNN